MNMQKFVVSGIVGGIVAFFAGWLVYGVLLMDFFAKNVGSATGVQRAMADMVWWALIAGNLCSGLLLSYIYNKWANITSFGAGFSGGLALGLLMSAMFDLTMYGTSNLSNLNGAIADIVCATVITGVTGGVVGLMNGKGKKAA